jgi:hypothetical protein
LLLEISRLISNNYERVKEFHQRFITLLYKIPDKSTEAIQIEYYTSPFPPLVSLFVEKKETRTLAENFVEDIKVEKDLASIYTHQGMRKVKLPPQKRMGRRTRR